LTLEISTEKNTGGPAADLFQRTIADNASTIAPRLWSFDLNLRCPLLLP